MAQRKFRKIDCDAIACAVANIELGGAATGADTTTSWFSLDGYSVAVYNQGANTTNISFQHVIDANCCNGLELPSTNTDNVGCHIAFGSGEVSNPDHPGCFKVGTDPAFYMKCKIGIPDVSDYDSFFVGFAEPGAFVDNIAATADVVAAYDEKAGFGLGDNAGDVDIMTSLADSDVSTDITVTDWTDDDVMTMQVNVSAAGVTTYRWWGADGTEDTSTGAVAFTFADATVLQPLIIAIKCANAADTPPILNYIEWGYQ